MEEVSHIIAGTDFSAPAGRAVARAIALAAEHRASLEIVHACGGRLQNFLSLLGLDKARQQRTPDQRRALLDTQVQKAQAAGVEATGGLYTTSPSAALEEALTRSKAGLVVLGAGNEASDRPRPLGTTAERLIKSGAPRTLVCRLEPQIAYRNALACVALAPISERVIQAAAQLSESLDVTVFHAYEPPFERKVQWSFGASLSGEAFTNYEADVGETTRRELHELLADLDLPADRLRPLIRRGHPPQALLNAAFMHRCEVVVVGRTKWRIAEKLLGDIARHVLREAPCDVMVINN